MGSPLAQPTPGSRRPLSRAFRPFVGPTGKCLVRVETGRTDRDLTLMRAGPDRREQPLQRRRYVMAQDRQPAVPFRSDPVELDDSALAGKGLVAVPGIVGALER